MNDFEWSPRSALQISSFPEHMFKAVVKQPERLEAKTFGLGCLGQQGFILESSWEACQSWSKLWMMKSAWASTNTSTILQIMTPGNWFRIAYINRSQEWNSKILKDMKRTNSLSEKNASLMSVPAFCLKGLRFGRFDRRFLGTLIPNCWLKKVIAPNMKCRHLESYGVWLRSFFLNQQTT